MSELGRSVSEISAMSVVEAVLADRTHASEMVQPFTDDISYVPVWLIDYRKEDN